MLRDGWGGIDGLLSVSEEPRWLRDDADALEIAAALTHGSATSYLPTVYISAFGRSDWLIAQDDIERLALDLGGIAHVVVEPSRAFSFQLRDLTNGSNAYGGAFGLALPGRGIVRRFGLGVRFSDRDELQAVVREAAIGIRSQMPAEGWDWTELQEQALRRHRLRERRRLSAEEMEQLYREEITNLHEAISQLKGQLASRPPEHMSDLDDGLLPNFIMLKLGPEIYPGEFGDRLRFAARECSARGDQIGLDRRTKRILDLIVEHLAVSPALLRLRDDLKRATKDPKRLASEVSSLLKRHGYQEKADNKHIRLQSQAAYGGLDSITLAKTPSDMRGLINTRKEVERTLGISRLVD